MKKGNVGERERGGKEGEGGEGEESERR